jgi:hypothetical protein
MHKVLHLAVRHPSFRELCFSFVKFANQSDSCPSPWGISAPCSWLSQPQTTMARLTSCNVLCAASLPLQALIRSQISILVAFQHLKPLGRYLTPGESNHALNHSCRMIPSGYFNPTGLYGKTSHTNFLQFSPFRAPHTLTMLHSFHLRVAIGFGSPHHYYPCRRGGLGFQVTTSPRFAPYPVAVGQRTVEY